MLDFPYYSHWDIPVSEFLTGLLTSIGLPYTLIATDQIDIHTWVLFPLCTQMPDVQVHPESAENGGISLSEGTLDGFYGPINLRVGDDERGHQPKITVCSTIYEHSAVLARIADTWAAIAYRHTD